MEKEPVDYMPSEIYKHIEKKAYTYEEQLEMCIACVNCIKNEKQLGSKASMAKYKLAIAILTDKVHKNYKINLD